MAIVLEMAAGTGGFLGGLYAYRFSPELLMIFLGSVVLLAAVSMLKNYGGNGRVVRERFGLPGTGIESWEVNDMS